MYVLACETTRRPCAIAGMRIHRLFAYSIFRVELSFFDTRCVTHQCHDREGGEEQSDQERVSPVTSFLSIVKVFRCLAHTKTSLKSCGRMGGMHMCYCVTNASLAYTHSTHICHTHIVYLLDDISGAYQLGVKSKSAHARGKAHSSPFNAG